MFGVNQQYRNCRKYSLHYGEKPNNCEVCLETLNLKILSLLHSGENKTKEKPYMCVVCLTTLNRTDNFKKGNIEIIVLSNHTNVKNTQLQSISEHSSAE